MRHKTVRKAIRAAHVIDDVRRRPYLAEQNNELPMTG